MHFWCTYAYCWIVCFRVRLNANNPQWRRGGGRSLVDCELNVRWYSNCARVTSHTPMHCDGVTSHASLHPAWRDVINPCLAAQLTVTSTPPSRGRTRPQNSHRWQHLMPFILPPTTILDLNAPRFAVRLREAIFAWVPAQCCRLGEH